MDEKIFISYRRVDAGFAGRISDHLKALFPEFVFMDVESLQPGVDFVEEIKRTISSSKVVLALIGKRWMVSSDKKTRLGDEHDYVTLEIQTACDLNIPVIPVLIDGAAMPHETNLPGGLEKFCRRNAIEISHSRFERDMQDLGKALYGYVGLKPPTRLEKFMESLPYGAKWDEKMRAYMAITSVVIGLLMVVMVIMLPPGGFLSVGIAGLLGGVFTGIIGLNSFTRRKLAVIGLCLSGLAFFIGLGLSSEQSSPDLAGPSSPRPQPFEPTPTAPEPRVENEGRPPSRPPSPTPTRVPRMSVTGRYQGVERFTAGMHAGATVMFESSFQQNASAVTGAYANAAGDAGIVSGTVEGNIFGGRVDSRVAPGAYCEFRATLSNGGEVMQGLLQCNTGDQAQFVMNRQ